MLEITWFILWGLLWAIYFVLDGFDFGMGTLLPFIAKDNTERRIVYNSAGPFWDGNEVWLVSAGGITFAAFPKVYAIMFSSLYAPLLIILFALIFRAVSFEFRAKIDNTQWRSLWDFFQFVGNFIPAFLFGVTFANLFMGIPFTSEGIYTGNILKLLSPYGLLGGIFFTLMFCYHGALWLGIKAPGELHERAIDFARKLWIPLIIVTVAFLALSFSSTNLYSNYLAHPVLWIIPLLAVIAILVSLYYCIQRKPAFAWFGSALFIFFVVFFGIAGLFPNLLISSIDPSSSLTLHNASASTLTLKIMLGVVLFTVPAVLAYQLWVFLTFTHKVTEEELKSETAY